MQFSRRKLEALADVVGTTGKRFVLARYMQDRGYSGWDADVEAGIQGEDTARDLLDVLDLMCFVYTDYHDDGRLRGARVEIDRKATGPCETLFEKVYEFTPEEREQWLLDRQINA